jgi:Fe2+ or Zn2+ uptake regulation protein
VDEIRQLGISKATAYRVLSIKMKSGEVTLLEESQKDGNVRTVFALASTTLPATNALVREALTKLKSNNDLVREQALLDLRLLSKNPRIVDNKTLSHLISIAETEPSLAILEILANQAIHAQKDQDGHTIEVLQTFIPTATSVAKDTGKPPEVREQALRFLQLTANFDKLSELAIEIISQTKDPALTTSTPTQFASDIQSICVRAARLAKYRSKIYDLLLKEGAVVTRAQQILNLSREPPFL